MSLQNDVYNKIKKAIIYGELGPGEKLSEIDVAKELDVSRTPIRETFRQLQMEGYITFVPNRGAFVSRLSPEEVEGIYDIVSLLEGYGAGLAAKTVSESELKELKRLQKKLVVLASKKKYREYIEANTAFHRHITSLSGNASLDRVVTELRARIYRYRLTSVTIPGYLQRYASDHEKIAGAISDRDSVQAEKYMRDHVNFVKKILVTHLKMNPGFFIKVV